ncbi:hypothetical protein BAU15_05930 [Enterococcus sp. JM4C]|uniref:ABC transporter permease n=1 Tax=Candidatus Enterococcus huntleyi TaxID=1857217 RepID=UPI00137B0D94|nr:ABC transporter permease [Enterococcus sp. JM4C]KAF1297089.1 hypothetical protein BAU15_05930 [Enterococcus sp. JM4C]
MVYRLAVRSFLKQLQVYFGYFLSMAVAVMIYYSFSAMTYDQPLLRRASQDVRIESFLKTGSIMVILVILFFMVSANRFFVNKRYKEVGLYRLFGMSKVRISVLFFGETIVLGSFSSIVGIFFGIIFSKLFSMILVKAMNLSVESDFFISWPSIGNTVVVFFFVLLLVSIRSTLMIFQYQLTGFFKKRTSLLAKKLRMTFWTYFFGVLGVVMIGTGYGLAVYGRNVLPEMIAATDSFGWIVVLPFLIFILCVLGTYLFFGYTLKVIYHLLGAWRNRLYTKLHVLTLGNAKVHLANNWRMMAWVAIILGTSLALIGGTAFFASVIMRTVQLDNPASFQVKSEEVDQVKQLLNEREIPILEEVSLKYKVVAAEVTTAIADKKETFVTVTNLITEKEYSSFRAINPNLPEVSLMDDKHAVVLDSLRTIPEGIEHYEPDLLFSGNIAATYQSTIADYLGDSSLRYMGMSGVTFVVSDEVFSESKGLIYQIDSLNISAEDEEKYGQELASQLTQTWGDEVISTYHSTASGLAGTIKPATNKAELNANQASSLRLNLNNRFPNIRASRRQMGVLTYVAVFIGMVCMIATGSILMLRQFSEANTERENYRLLKKMGISRKQLNHFTYERNARVFFTPMIVGISHAYFAIHFFSEFSATASYWLAYLFCGLLMLVYIFFYVLTILLYGRIVEK